MKVTILGNSKVGRTLTLALRARGHTVSLRPRRATAPRKPIDSPLVVVSTRDDEIEKLASELARTRSVSPRAAVVHTAGGAGPDVLAPLRGIVAGIGQAHPLLSFASAGAPPDFRSAHMLVRGDAVAVRRARTLARAVGMVPRSWDVDVALYHAAAGLLANGAAALAALAGALLGEAGAPQRDVARALGPLLRSVGQNVELLGLPFALTGPVRRGDVSTVRRHLDAIERVSPETLPAYLAMGIAQLPLARALADAKREDLDRLAKLFAAHGAKTPVRRSRK
jgi:predicted short-subunit dehydrogenase-like oxidoreductase (DUF2520 family)